MHPPLQEILSHAVVLSLPLVTRFRGIDTREVMLLEGPEGWSEFSPFTEYGDHEASAWLRATIEFGWRPVPPQLRDRIPVNATIPAVPATQVPSVLARFPGCRTAKVKVAGVGHTLVDDTARVQAVRDALGPEGRIRIDANGGWNVDEAEHAVRTLSQFDLEYVEQPCQSLEDLAEVRQRIKYLGVKVAADESVRRADDPLAVARAGAADILVVKAQPLGGIRAALRVAEEAGLPMVVSSALDTSVGISMGAYLAASMPELEYDCGLGTVSLFESDVAVSPLIPVDGAIDVRRVWPDARALNKHQASPERRQWWFDRLERCYALLNSAT